MQENIIKLNASDVVDLIYSKDFSVMLTVAAGSSAPQIDLLFTHGGKPICSNSQYWDKTVYKALKLRGININLNNINVDRVNFPDCYIPQTSEF